MAYLAAASLPFAQFSSRFGSLVVYGHVYANSRAAPKAWSSGGALLELEARRSPEMSRLNKAQARPTLGRTHAHTHILTAGGR